MRPYCFGVLSRVRAIGPCMIGRKHDIVWPYCQNWPWVLSFELHFLTPKTLELTGLRGINLTILNTWWLHQMETFSTLLAFCEGNSPVTGCLMFSLICALKKQLSKQSWGWWFETPWTHYDVIVMISYCGHQIPHTSRFWNGIRRWWKRLCSIYLRDPL